MRDRLKQTVGGVPWASGHKEQYQCSSWFIHLTNTYFPLAGTVGKEKQVLRWVKHKNRSRLPGVTSDTPMINLMWAQLNSRTCQPEQKIGFMPWTGFFFWITRITKVLGLQLGGTGKSRRWPFSSFSNIHWLSLVHHCSRCFPSLMQLFCRAHKLHSGAPQTRAEKQQETELETSQISYVAFLSGRKGK